MDNLKQFYADKHMMKAVEKSLDVFLAEQIVERTFSGKDTTGYKEARDIFRSYLKNLDKIYGADPSKKDNDLSDGE